MNTIYFSPDITLPPIKEPDGIFCWGDRDIMQKKVEFVAKYREFMVRQLKPVEAVCDLLNFVWKAKYDIERNAISKSENAADDPWFDFFENVATNLQLNFLKTKFF